MPSVPNLFIRITAQTDANTLNESWIIDDVELSGDLASPTPSLFASPALSNLNYNLDAGPSASQSFNLDGSNLTPAADSITITAPANFQVARAAGGPYSNTFKVGYSGGSLSATPIFVQLIAGLGVNSYSGNVNISGGSATAVNLAVSGNVTNDNCADLFISEYIEGSSNNKCLEIYNPTGSSINLSGGGYQLRFYSNGGSTASTTINLTGTISPYGTHTVCNTTSSATFLALANQTSSSSWYNGDDAVELSKNSGAIVLDIFGRIGEDPGSSWSATGIQTSDRTLVRKPEIRKGINVNPGSLFPTLATEWLNNATDVSSFLGSHISVCQSPNIISTGAVVPSASYCPGSSVRVPFQALGTYASGNVFTAQLSDATGSFSTPVSIGTVSLSGSDLIDTINATMPASILPSGTGYRIRVISSNPTGQYIPNPNTITAPTLIPNNVSGPGSSSSSQQINLNWTIPTGCWDEIIVVVTDAAGIQFTPTGDGSSYTANSIFGSFNQVVYKGTGNTVSITNLNNTTTYHFEIFVRFGSNWSSGVEWSAIPDVYCIPQISATCIPYISSVRLDTFINNTAPGCGIRGYSSFVDKTITLVKGQTYTLGVQSGRTLGEDYRAFNSDNIRAWIDWDQDLTFSSTPDYLFPLPISNISGPSGYTTFTVPANAPTGLTRMRIRLMNPSSTSPCVNTTSGEIEDYTIHVVEPCSAASIGAFYPTSGALETEVKITGSNFTGVTQVVFNNTLAPSFQVVNDSTILALVPANSGTGRISLVKGACTVLSADAFSYLNSIGCSGTYPDLFISEVYSDGNFNHVEIFNGSENTIDLDKPDNYSLRLTNAGVGNILTQVIDINGSIAPGQTRLYYINTDGVLANGTQGIAGFELDDTDTIRLVKNHSNVLDIMIAGAADDFTYQRLTTAVAPSSTFNTADWSISAPSTADLGTFGTPSAPYVISPGNPVDVSGCTINMFAGTSNPALTYEWFYNDNRNNQPNWVSLISFPPAGTTVTGANNFNLTITGTLNSLDKNQFRVVITDGTCTRYSQSAQFTLVTDSFYRTRQTGNWLDASSWQTAPTASGPWAEACTYPEEKNSKSVRIRENHTITLNNNDSIYCSQITIDSAGTLMLEEDADLLIPNRAGVDLMVNGVLEDKSDNKGMMDTKIGIQFIDNSTWMLGSFGEITKTNNTTAVKYRDQYEGGISNIPATAIWRYRKITTTNPIIVTNNMFYPNLFFENGTGGVYDQTSSSAFQGNVQCVIKGDMNVGLTGNPVTVRSRNTSSGLLQILGDLNIGNGSTLTNIDGFNIGTGFDVKGDINNNGIFSTNRRLQVSGNGTQIIQGSGSFSIDTLIVDKPARNIVDMRVSLSINRQIQFGNGGIIQTGANTLNIANGNVTNAITGYESPNGTGQYANDKYVFGRLSRRIANGSTATYEFPIGDAPPPTGIGYNPSKLEIGSTPNNNTVTASFVASSPGTINAYRKVSCDTTFRVINHVGFTGLGYWRMDGGSTTQYNIWLHPNELNVNNNPNFDIDTLGFVNNYRALKEDNGRAGLPWDPAVVEAGDPCVVSTNYYQIPGFGYSGFSIFAPGGGGTALPVELISFTGTCVENGVELSWSTASEFNSDYFLMERSDDGILFSGIGVVNAAGFSNTIQRYTFRDKENLGNLSYYRIREFDLDGKEYLYPIITTECAQLKKASFRVFHVPGEGIVANWEQFRTGNVSFSIYDAAGRQLSNALFNTQPGIIRERISNGTTLAQGIYMISMQDGERLFSAKVFVP